MSVKNETNELIEAGIISRDVAEKIQAYYSTKEKKSGNRLFLVFGILGALLVGLGIILIIAHNWDNLTRPVKTFLSFLPLLIGQIACIYVISKRYKEAAWREGASVFLFLAVGASISLVSQVYHIKGDLGDFMLTWMLLVLPLIYIMNSSMTSLLYLVGITAYGVEANYLSSHNQLIFWALFLADLPFYIKKFIKDPASNFTVFHHWFIAISLTICLGIVSGKHEEFMFLTYMALFAFFILLGNTSFFENQRLINNGYRVVGTLGSLVVLLILSFSEFWSKLYQKKFIFTETIFSPEVLVCSGIVAISGWLVYNRKELKDNFLNDPMNLVFPTFVLVFLIGLYTEVVVVLVNLMLFAIGIKYIISGSRRLQLGAMNFGLLIIAALITCRFFDTDLSFVVRGIMFVLVGVGFFVANYRLLKKKSAHE